MLVNEIMSKNVVSVSPEQTVSNAAKLMSEYNIGAIPVAKDGKIKGIITDRDIVLRCVASEKDYSDVRVSDVMSPSAVFVSGESDVNEALSLMSKEQIRRLPVTSNGKLCGMLSIADIALHNFYDTEFSKTISDISKP